jgi:hypothetical protein
MEINLIKSVGYLFFKDSEGRDKFLLIRREGETSKGEYTHLKPIGATYTEGENEYVSKDTQTFERGLKEMLESIEGYFSDEHIDRIIEHSRLFTTISERLVFTSFLSKAGACILEMSKIDDEKMKNKSTKTGYIQMDAFYVESFTTRELNYIDPFEKGYAWEKSFPYENNKRPEAHKIEHVITNLFRGKMDFYRKVGFLALERYLSTLTPEEIEYYAQKNADALEISANKQLMFRRLIKGS